MVDFVGFTGLQAGNYSTTYAANAIVLTGASGAVTVSSNVIIDTNGNVGIATSTVPAGDKLVICGGNVDICTVGFGLRFPDNTYMTTAAVGGAAKYSTTIGNGSATSFTITHSLAKADVFVAIREVSSGYFVYPDIKYVDTNSVILEFATAPTTNQYYVSVIGA